jgi:hypothetical protein
MHRALLPCPHEVFMVQALNNTRIFVFASVTDFRNEQTAVSCLLFFTMTYISSGELI